MQNKIIIEEARKNFPGWKLLLDTLENSLECLAQPVSIQEITTRYGMLSVKFEKHDNPYLTTVLEGLSFIIERKCVRVCILCGSKGSRRNNLENKPYCFQCWVVTSNDVHDSTGE
jgi:hypothetical protein